MDGGSEKSAVRNARILIISIVGVCLVVGFILVIRLTAQANIPVSDERPDALAGSQDACVECHRQSSPGIVQQYSHSSMASANVTCNDCHVVSADYPGAIAHEGSYVLHSPSTAKCQSCHAEETAQYLQSRHALPSWVAVVGSKDLPADLMAQYQSIPEGQFAPNKERNAIAALEGEDITHFACETCHAIGKPAVDSSTGQCQKCHLRHEFSLEQARKPETCNACHIGPDHPQWEIYQESPHGIAYATGGYRYNWEAEPGTLTVKDFPAATCSVCHMSGFGGAPTTHDVGDRLSWYLFASVSQRRPDWEKNKQSMQSVCLECHNQQFVNDLYDKADNATLAVNAFVDQGSQIMTPLREGGLISPKAFDEPIEYQEFELWHHWGRTAKFGLWMQGPDYTQWHGAYEMVKTLTEMKAMAEDILNQ
ncbi:MAG: nitrate reductase [Anaerolineae bacterium]|nr:nitrate reductase [Anaerolineae bacterium]